MVISWYYYWTRKFGGAVPFFKKEEEEEEQIKEEKEEMEQILHLEYTKHLQKQLEGHLEGLVVFLVGISEVAAEV